MTETLRKHRQLASAHYQLCSTSAFPCNNTALIIYLSSSSINLHTLLNRIYKNTSTDCSQTEIILKQKSVVLEMQRMHIDVMCVLKVIH